MSGGSSGDSLPEGIKSHRKDAERFSSVACGVLTVSDSRTIETDESGKLICDLLISSGHRVVEQLLLPNDEDRVREAARRWSGRDDIHAIIITGGTGLGSRDRSIEAVTPLFEREIPGFGELFRYVSFNEQVGAAAMLSRSAAGVVNQKFVCVLPGSSSGVELAMKRLILPEISHILRELSR